MMGKQVSNSVHLCDPKPIAVKKCKSRREQSRTERLLIEKSPPRSKTLNYRLGNKGGNNFVLLCKRPDWWNLSRPVRTRTLTDIDYNSGKNSGNVLT